MNTSSGNPPFQEENQPLLLLWLENLRGEVIASHNRRFSVSPNREAPMKRDTGAAAYSFHSREREPVESNKSLFDAIRKQFLSRAIISLSELNDEEKEWNKYRKRTSQRTAHHPHGDNRKWRCCCSNICSRSRG